ncbi:uncharacterized protein A4U43_C03F18910 [Asparagus officinalis]|uniref:DUF4094 domain-containing protein n=1 Tax=Asparagus officinalis TaxID=4686 RepID=A0A5P1FG77_ASPOF|nr:uncharacterized protein A4U43_C03F18910 [Asparagus officinalis]
MVLIIQLALDDRCTFANASLDQSSEGWLANCLSDIDTHRSSGEIMWTMPEAKDIIRTTGTGENKMKLVSSDCNSRIMTEMQEPKSIIGKAPKTHTTIQMSTEMVACIAIEAISILEKMHSKGGLSLVGMVEDAKKVLDEMGHLGFKPSGFEYRVVIQWYGWLGSFKKMRRVIGTMGDAEIRIDTICADLVLSCYGE